MNDIIIACAICAIGFASGFGLGYHRADKVCSNEKLELSQAVNEKSKEQNKAVDKIITKYVTITREIPIYEPSKDNTCTILDGNFRVFHDGAAGYLMPTTSGSPDAASVHIEEVAATIALNYHGCAQNTDQMSALQDWAREVSK